MTNWYTEWDNDADISLNSFIERETKNERAPKSYQRFFKNLKQEIGNVTNQLKVLSEEIIIANAERDNYRDYYRSLQNSYNDLTELYKKEHWLRLEKETSLLEAWSQVTDQKELVKKEKEKVKKLTTEVNSLSKKLEEITTSNNNSNANKNNNEINKNQNNDKNNNVNNSDESNNNIQLGKVDNNNTNNEVVPIVNNVNNNNNNSNNNNVNNNNNNKNITNTYQGTYGYSSRMENMVLQISAQLNELQNENKALQDKYQQTQQKNDALNQQFKSLENQLLQSAQRRQAMEKQLIDQLKTINQLKNQVTTSQEIHVQASNVINDFQRANQELVYYKMVFSFLNNTSEGSNLLQQMVRNPELHQTMRNLYQLHVTQLQQQQQQQTVLTNNMPQMNDGVSITILPSSSPTTSSTNTNQNYHPQG